MLKFNNILFVTRGTGDETEGLAQAINLARNNNAPLNVLIVCPNMSEAMKNYEDNFKDSLVEQFKEFVAATLGSLNINGADLPVNIELKSTKTPAIYIIQQVLKNGYDLVIKDAEKTKNGDGFRALDMNLLSKCPCPLWLCRPIEHSCDETKVAVAIDAEDQNPEAQQLSKTLLKIANDLSNIYDKKMHIISCWDYAYEEYLHKNVWIKTSDEEIAQNIEQERQEHSAALDVLIKETNIGDSHDIHNVRGTPDEMIPSFIREQDIDVLVMGTVGRTGIDGLLIGNTAENIVQRLSCSLLALKPDGFITPVKLDD